MEIKKDVLDLAIEEAKAQERAAEKKKRDDAFRKELKAGLKNLAAELMPTEEQQVKIPLSEYISLVYMARDLDTLKNVILDSLTLASYSKAKLKIEYDNEDIASALSVLFPEEYKAKYNKLKASEEGE